MSQIEFTLGFNDMRKEVMRCIESGLVPIIKGPPGIAKSALTRSIAKEYDAALIDDRLGQAAPEDLQGLPFKNNETGKAEFMPFSKYPTVGDKLPGGKQQAILFLDEFTSMNKSVEAAAYKLVLDRMVGEKPLHPDVAIVCAGNRDIDNSVARPLGKAMGSRIVHFTMRCDWKDTMAYAHKVEWDYRVLGYLEMERGAIHAFDPDSEEPTFACPRTWEMLSDGIKDRPTEEVTSYFCSGTIGQQYGIPFQAFAQVFDDMPKMSQVLAAPSTTRTPTDMQTRFAMASMLASNTTVKNLEDIVTYVKRLPKEIQVVYFRSVYSRSPMLAREEAFVNGTMDITEFMYADISTAA